MTYDTIIIGGGPAGLSVAASLQDAGVNVLVVERKHIGYNVSRFPVCMRFFSSRALVELNDFALTIPDEKPTREQYMAYLYHFAKGKKIPVADYTNVQKVVKNKNLFQVETLDKLGRTQNLQAKTVVVAAGALDHPQMLGVEGEDLPHVTHYFNEVYPYVGHRTLVVGSGNGAVETALLLFRAESKPALSFRTPELDRNRIKYWMYPDIAKRLEKNQVENLSATRIVKIEKDKVTFKPLSPQPGEEFTRPFDFVIAQIGYEPPVEFLRQMGVNINADTKIPEHDEATLESNVEGLFIAGAIVGGNVSGKVFIENSRFHGAQILPRVKEIL